MSTWIRSRIADNLFIIGSPLIALLVIAVFCKTRAQSGYFFLDPSSPPWLGIMAFIALYWDKWHSLMHFWYDGFIWSVRKSDV